MVVQAQSSIGEKLGTNSLSSKEYRCQSSENKEDEECWRGPRSIGCGRWWREVQEGEKEIPSCWGAHGDQQYEVAELRRDSNTLLQGTVPWQEFVRKSFARRRRCDIEMLSPRQPDATFNRVTVFPKATVGASGLNIFAPHARQQGMMTGGKDSQLWSWTGATQTRGKEGEAFSFHGKAWAVERVLQGRVCKLTCCSIRLSVLVQAVLFDPRLPHTVTQKSWCIIADFLEGKFAKGSEELASLGFQARFCSRTSLQSLSLVGLFRNVVCRHPVADSCLSFLVAWESVISC